MLGCEPPDAVLPKGYKDRADKRRKTVGSQNSNEKTEVACVTQWVNNFYTSLVLNVINWIYTLNN